MKFYDVLIISKKGRLTLLPYFEPGTKVVLAYDDENDWFEIEPILEGATVEWALEIDSKGKLDLPWWVLDGTEGFLTSLEKDKTGKVRKMILVPIEGLADLVGEQKKDEDKKTKVPRPPSKVKVNYTTLPKGKELVEQMLLSAFGPEFDVEASDESCL